jgi:hypothetical protein
MPELVSNFLCHLLTAIIVISSVSFFSPRISHFDESCFISELLYSKDGVSMTWYNATFTFSPSSRGTSTQNCSILVMLGHFFPECID